MSQRLRVIALALTMGYGCAGEKLPAGLVRVEHPSGTFSCGVPKDWQVDAMRSATGKTLLRVVGQADSSGLPPVLLMRVHREGASPYANATHYVAVNTMAGELVMPPSTRKIGQNEATVYSSIRKIRMGKNAAAAGRAREDVALVLIQGGFLEIRLSGPPYRDGHHAAFGPILKTLRLRV